MSPLFEDLVRLRVEDVRAEAEKERLALAARKRRRAGANRGNQKRLPQLPDGATQADR